MALSAAREGDRELLEWKDVGDGYPEQAGVGQPALPQTHPRQAFGFAACSGANVRRQRRGQERSYFIAKCDIRAIERDAVFEFAHVPLRMIDAIRSFISP